MSFLFEIYSILYLKSNKFFIVPKNGLIISQIQMENSLKIFIINSYIVGILSIFENLYDESIIFSKL